MSDEIIDWPEPPDQKDLRIVNDWWARKKLNEYMDNVMNPDQLRHAENEKQMINETGPPDGPDEEFDTENTESPVCPYCGYKDDDWWGDGCDFHASHTVFDGADWDKICPICDTEYRITIYITQTFDTKKL